MNSNGFLYFSPPKLHLLSVEGFRLFLKGTRTSGGFPDRTVPSHEELRFGAPASQGRIGKLFKYFVKVFNDFGSESEPIVLDRILVLTLVAPPPSPPIVIGQTLGQTR